MKKLIFALLILCSGAAQAALIDRGDGFIYDDVLDITWTQNANINGGDTWANQLAWADGYSQTHSVYGTFDDWRLASMDVNGDDTIVDCSSALNSEALCQDNEYGHLFYYDGITRGTPGLFTNVQSPVYFSGTEYAPSNGNAWDFQFVTGSQGYSGADDFDDNLYAWAVMDGDVASVTTIPAVIDIKPGADRNAINPRSKGVIPVAILSTNTADGDSTNFDATQVDTATVVFGPGEALISHPGTTHVRDVDADRDADLVLHFRAEQTGIVCGDTEASLHGETFSGDTFGGTDAIETVGCPRAPTAVD